MIVTGGLRVVDLADNFASAFRFRCPTEIIFGAGVSAELAPRVSATSARRIMIVADKAAAEGSAAECLDKLDRESALDVATWYIPGGEPTMRGVSAGAEVARSLGPELVVAVGGGSAIDTAKVLAVVAAAPARVGLADVLKPGKHAITGNVPLWTLPTIPGTGAEVTRGTVIGDDAGTKVGFSSGGCYPELALLDPVLAASVPARLLGPPTADVLCHAVEGFLTARAFPIGDLLTTAAIALVGQAMEEPLDQRSTTSTSHLMQAALFATIAFSSGAGLTIAHQFSDIAGLPLGLPHGYAAALLLPAVIATGAGLGPGRVELLGRLLGDLGWAGTPADYARSLLRKLGAPDLPAVCDMPLALELVSAVTSIKDGRYRISPAEGETVVRAAFDSYV